MNKKFSIVIFGGRGFVGKEIISLLNHHDHIELKKVFSSTKDLDKPLPISPVAPIIRRQEGFIFRHL